MNCRTSSRVLAATSAGGPLATLPLLGRRSGITWVERTGDAAALAELPGTRLLALLSELTGGALGGLEIESGPGTFPLGAQHARSYVAPRVALVGDAAHGVHPIHAQGFNMGVADVGALVEALVEARARRKELREHRGNVAHLAHGGGHRTRHVTARAASPHDLLG